jgi:hypothetical protein
MVTDTAANAADPGSLTYGGQAMTRVTEGDFNDNPGSGGYHFRTGLYILKAYPEGAQSFVWTPDYSSSKASLGVACHLFFFDNVDQTTPVETGNIGKQSAISPNIAPVITTVDSNSLVLLDVFRSSAYFSGSFPVTPGTGVTTVHDENLGSGAGDAGQLATYSGIKSAPTPGVNTPTATIHDPTGILCLAVEIKGHAAGATFTIGVHDVVNVGAGGPDISTDLAPIDWPVAEGTGLGGAGGGVPPPNNPTPAPVFATILQSHGLGLAENRDFSTGELAGFASHASCFRTFGHMRNVAGAPAFAGDTANTTLIAQLLATGAAVIHCPIAAGPQSYNTQFPDVTDLVSVNAIGDYLASIAAAALARGWATDKYVLELFDEPLSTQGMAATKQIYQIWVNKIRAANPDIWIAAVGNGREGNNGWEPDYESWAKTIPLNDPRSGEHRIAYGHHFFNTMNFTNQGTVSQWPAGVTYLQSGVNLTTMRAEMQRFRTWANIHGVQIYISSCGVDKLAPSLLDRQNWTTDFFTVCQELAIPAILRNDDSPGPGGAQGVFQLMSLAGAVMTLDPSWATIIGNFGTGVPIVTPIAAAMVGRGGAILEGIGRNFTHTELDNFSVIGHLRCDDDNEVTTAPAWDGTGVCAQQMLYLIGKGVPVQLCGPYMHYQNKGSGYAPYMSQMLTRSTAMANWVKNNNIPPNAFIWNPANEPTDRQVDWRTTLFPQLLAAWRAVLGPAYVVTEPISNGAVGNEGNWNWFDPLVNGSYVANADVNVIPSCHDYFDTVQATYNGQTTGTLQLPAGCTQANFTNLIYGPIGTWSRAHNRIVLVNEVGCVRIAPGRATYLGNKVAAAKASGVSITFFGMDFVGGQFALDTGNPRNIDPAIASIFV